MKIKVTVDIKTEEYFEEQDGPDAAVWFKDVLNIEQLHLHSNELGEAIGKVTKVEIV